MWTASNVVSVTSDVIIFVNTTLKVQIQSFLQFVPPHEHILYYPFPCNFNIIT